MKNARTAITAAVYTATLFITMLTTIALIGAYRAKTVFTVSSQRLFYE